MQVNNADSAALLVRDWVAHRERERAALGLPSRPLPDLVDRFGRWAADQEGCARICRTHGQPLSEAGHLDAARVLRAAAADAGRAA